MNLEDIKVAWQSYDESLKTTSRLHERLIVSMIADRSSTRVDNLKRKYIYGILWMLLCLGLGVAILVGNPFDYRYAIQYVAIEIYIVGLIILTAKLIFTYRNLSTILVTHHTIREALAQVITIYEKPNRFFKYTILLFLFSQVVLFPLSFLPARIEQMGFWPAVGDRLIPIAVSGLLAFAAYKLGLFRDKEEKKFRQDLEELDELKTLTKELEHG